MSLGKRLKDIRKQLDLNQTEFANKLGSTLGALSKYETDKVVPNDVFIHHLCKLFSINEVWLKTGEGDMYIAITEEDRFAELLGELLVTENEQIKDIITKSIELDDRDLDFVYQLVNRLLEDKKTVKK